MIVNYVLNYTWGEHVVLNGYASISTCPIGLIVSCVNTGDFVQRCTCFPRRHRNKKALIAYWYGWCTERLISNLRLKRWANFQVRRPRLQQQQQQFLLSSRLVSGRLVEVRRVTVGKGAVHISYNAKIVFLDHPPTLWNVELLKSCCFPCVFFAVDAMSLSSTKYSNSLSFIFSALLLGKVSSIWDINMCLSIRISFSA